MKNITLKIDDETHTKARILAAKRGTSISAMVREFLIDNTQHVADQSEILKAPRTNGAGPPRPRGAQEVTIEMSFEARHHGLRPSLTR